MSSLGEIEPVRERTLVIWLFVAFLVLGGVAVVFVVDWVSGIYLVLLGLFVALLQVLDIRRAGRIRRSVCPRCGQMMVEGSNVCTNCQFELE